MGCRCLGRLVAGRWCCPVARRHWRCRPQRDPCSWTSRAGRRCVPTPGSRPFSRRSSPARRARVACCSNPATTFPDIPAFPRSTRATWPTTRLLSENMPQWPATAPGAPGQAPAPWQWDPTLAFPTQGPVQVLTTPGLPGTTPVPQAFFPPIGGDVVPGVPRLIPIAAPGRTAQQDVTGTAAEHPSRTARPGGPRLLAPPLRTCLGRRGHHRRHWQGGREMAEARRLPGAAAAARRRGRAGAGDRHADPRLCA